LTPSLPARLVIAPPGVFGRVWRFSTDDGDGHDRSVGSSSTLNQAAASHDLVVMGETQDPSFASVFGDAYQRVADATDHPVIVVREHE
jgi:hypothetical protein